MDVPSRAHFGNLTSAEYGHRPASFRRIRYGRWLTHMRAHLLVIDPMRADLGEEAPCRLLPQVDMSPRVVPGRLRANKSRAHSPNRSRARSWYQGSSLISWQVRAERGSHELKGLPGRWDLFAAAQKFFCGTKKDPRGVHTNVGSRGWAANTRGDGDFRSWPFSDLIARPANVCSLGFADFSGRPAETSA